MRRTPSRGLPATDRRSHGLCTCSASSPRTKATTSGHERSSRRQPCSIANWASPSLFAACTHNLGLLAWHQQPLARVRPLLEEGLALHRAADSPGTVNSLVDLGLLAAVEQRATEDADQLLRESLALARAIAWNEGIAYCLEGLAAVASGPGRAGTGGTTHRRRGCARGADRPATGRLRTRRSTTARRPPSAERSATSDSRSCGTAEPGWSSTSSSDDVQTSFRGGRASWRRGHLPVHRHRGSTRLLEELGDGYGNLLEEHRNTVRDALAQHRGVEVDTRGDAFFAAFASARNAVEAASELQRARDEPSPHSRRAAHG